MSERGAKSRWLPGRALLAALITLSAGCGGFHATRPGGAPPAAEHAGPAGADPAVWTAAAEMVRAGFEGKRMALDTVGLPPDAAGVVLRVLSARPVRPAEVLLCTPPVCRLHEVDLMVLLSHPVEAPGGGARMLVSIFTQDPPEGVSVATYMFHLRRTGRGGWEVHAIDGMMMT